MKRKGTYIPDRGDAVWLTFGPHAGHEQSGRRPALVLSPASYNGLVGLALMCPITGQSKGYPFEVALSRELPVSGVILSDHVKSLDWRSRKAERICKVPDAVVAQVIARLNALLGQ